MRLRRKINQWLNFIGSKTGEEKRIVFLRLFHLNLIFHYCRSVRIMLDRFLPLLVRFHPKLVRFPRMLDRFSHLLERSPDIGFLSPPVSALST